VLIHPSQIVVPPGQSILLETVDWASFEAFLEQMSERPGMRLAYDAEVLELMTPLLEHEDDKEIIGDLIRALLEMLDIEFRSIGSTTLRSLAVAKGVEPDQCFYIAHESAIRGKRSIDLSVDPPPDLALEIDIPTRRDHRAIYAALRIPELWRFDGTRLHIYCRGVMAISRPSAATNSLALPSPKQSPDFSNAAGWMVAVPHCGPFATGSRQSAQGWMTRNPSKQATPPGRFDMRHPGAWPFADVIDRDFKRRQRPR